MLKAAEKQGKEHSESEKGKEDDGKSHENSKEDADEKLYNNKNSSKNKEEFDSNSKGNSDDSKKVQYAQEEKLKEGDGDENKSPIMVNGKPLKPAKEKHVSGVSLEDRLPPKFQKIVEANGMGPPPPQPVKPESYQKPTEATLVKQGTDSEGNKYVHYTDKPAQGKPISPGLPGSLPSNRLTEGASFGGQVLHHKPRPNYPEAISPLEQNKLLPPETIGPIKPGKPYIPADELPGNDLLMVSSHPLEAVGLPIAETVQGVSNAAGESSEPGLSVAQSLPGLSNNTVVEGPGDNLPIVEAPHSASNNIIESSGLGVESSFRFASFGSPVILHIGATGFDEGKNSLSYP